MEIQLLEKILQVKCPLHPRTSSDVLHITAGTNTHRACINCILGGNVHPFAAMDLRSLFKATDNEDCILKNYPPLDDRAIYEQLENIQQFSTGKLIESIVQQIGYLKHFFDGILDKLQKDSIIKVEEIGQQRRQVLDLYQSLCEPTKLKEAVTQASQGKQINRLHEEILKKCQDSAINQSKLQSAINQFQANYQKFSIKLEKQSIESLQNTIKNLSFFTSSINPLIYSYSILQQFFLAPSILYNSASRTVISRKENNQLDALCIRDNGYVCRLFSSNALDNNTHYSFRFAFHQEASESPPQFNIGLINKQDKDRQNNCNLIRYREHKYDCQINKIIKGVALKSSRSAKNVHKEVEMRVHLASRTVKVADFPNYNNVVELSDKRKIWLGSQYCILVELGGFVNDHITLKDVIASNGFDSSM